MSIQCPHCQSKAIKAIDVGRSVGSTVGTRYRALTRP